MSTRNDWVAFENLSPELIDEINGLGLDARQVYEHILVGLGEDLPSADAVDTTSAATISADATGEAVFAAREPGIVAGLVIAAATFAIVVPDAAITDRCDEGSVVAEGEVVMRIAGPIRGLLTAERTALNFASHLSGIATATAAWTEALGERTRVLDTRKTLPGWRALQKYAVRAGGGVNHRFSLADKAMVKDNHVIAAGGVVAAFEAVRAAFPNLPVEVEVTDLNQLREVLAAGCTDVLLDNMDDKLLAQAVRINATEFDRAATLEASGGMTLDRARAVAATGVDFVSTGALTHSVTVFDLGMDLQ